MLKMSNDERLRSLTIIYYTSMGCLNMILPIDDDQHLQDIVSSVVSYDVKYPFYHNKSKNLRMRLIIDIGNLLDILIENNSDNVNSIKLALKIYSLSSIFYGITKDDIYKLSRDIQSNKRLIKNKLSDKRQNPRFLSIKSVELQFKKIEMNNCQILTEIDKKIILKLFDLSINRYSEVELNFFPINNFKDKYFRTWKQQKSIMPLLCLLLQKNVSIPHSCIQTFVDFLIHDNMELRQCATKGIVALCHLQKPPRIYAEKILHNINQSSSNIDINNNYSVDYNDNSWITIDSFKPPEAQIEWEQICFLDKSFYGYYTWPKIIKYSINTRIRYTQHTMPENVAILYNRFIDKNFLKQFIKLIIFDEDNDIINFNKTRFTTFKSLFCNFGSVFIDNFKELLYLLIYEEMKENEKGSHRVATEIVVGMILGSKNFQWRIPSIWYSIHQQAKILFDHPSKSIRKISISLSLDITLSNKNLIHEPNVNQFFDDICERLREVIEIYDKKPLINASNQAITLEFESCKALNFTETVCINSKWHAHRAAIDFIQNMIFCNLFNARQYAKQLHRLVIKCLFDEQLEQYFCMMSKTNYFTIIDSKKVTLTKNIITRHGGILGLCAMVLSSPYNISSYISDALIFLCKHSNDRHMIQVKLLTDQLENVLQAIASSQARRRFYAEDPITFDIFNRNIDRTSTDLNGEFMFSRLLIDTLLRMNTYETDRSEFIDLCKIQYQTNPFELISLHNFELTYSADQALQWYTKESFLYRLLNKALRVRNIDLLYLIRFFIRDLYKQLTQIRCSTPQRVFRGQLMSVEEFQVFQQSLGQCVSMNSFISTSLNRDLALFYLGDRINDSENGPKRLLFEINADPLIESSKPFAEISSFSNFPEEEEVLFMLGSVFHLDSIVFEPNERIWSVEMTLRSDNEHQTKNVYEKMRNELCAGDETPNLIHLGNILYDMGQFEKAEKYFRRLLNNLPNEHPDIA
ncbi:unnamed protein product, partial [Rotaria sp. Silwood1]